MVIVATPGSTVALASTKAVKFGLRASIFTIFGDALGTAVQIVVAVLGLKVLIAVAESWLPYMQMVGGLYIIYLAVENLRSGSKSVAPDHQSRSDLNNFVSGFLVCVSNPKSIIFFIALFPGFIDPALSIVFQSAVYGAIFVLLDATFIFSYSLLALRTIQSPLGRSMNVAYVSAFGLFVVGALLLASGLDSIGWIESVFNLM